MNSKATLRKNGVLIATIEGQNNLVTDFVYANIEMYKLVHKPTNTPEWVTGYSDMYVNGEIVLMFKLEEI